jgi:hypothetical protein
LVLCLVFFQCVLMHWCRYINAAQDGPGLTEWLWQSDSALPKHFMNNATHRLVDSVVNAASYFRIPLNQSCIPPFDTQFEALQRGFPMHGRCDVDSSNKHISNTFQRNAKLCCWQCFTLRLRNCTGEWKSLPRQKRRSNCSAQLLHLIFRYNSRAAPKLGLQNAMQADTAVFMLIAAAIGRYAEAAS